MKMKLPYREFTLILSLLWILFHSPAPACEAQDAKGEETTKNAAESDDDERDRRALERFEVLLEKNPRKGTALDRVYGFYVERGSLESLIKKYEDRVGHDPTDGTSWLILGLVESQRGRDAAAVNALRKAEAASPGDALPSFYLGQALVLVGQPDEATSAFERALERKPSRNDVLEIFQALGRVYQRGQKSKEAMDVWNRLEKLFPDDTRVQEQIAGALAEEGQPEEALPRYEALARQVKDPFRQVQFAITAAELKVRLGKVAEALREFESQLGKLRPDSWLQREVRHKIEEVYLRNDDQAGLANYYESWIEKNPDDVEAYYLLGRTLAGSGRGADARVWLDRAVKLAPTRRDLRLALINQLEEDRKYADAASQYEELSKREPNNPDLVRDWGALLLRDNTRPEIERKLAAAKVWRKLLDARPNDPVTTAQVGDLLRRAELVDDALSLYRRAIELAPENAQYREYLGEYLHALKRPEEALEVWAAIAEGDNRNSANLARLAEVYAGFGYLKQAIPKLTEAVELDQDEFVLRLKLAEYLHRADRFEDSDQQLRVADRLAEDPEERSAVLEAQIKNDQAAGVLEARIEEFQKAITDGQQSVTDLVKLARYLEVGGKLPLAIHATEKAVELEPRSVQAWSLLARLQESSGRLSDAADAFRRLTEIDRRNRTEYLGGISKLEARLGRADAALSAGRDLIAAAPGNPEHYEFFANLCFQLGRSEEGLETLRRAVRVNPSDTKVLTSLAETLSGLFRTEEAIETYWRAFEKEKQFDARVGMISRLTELYLQRNQLDRLLSRLQREQNEAPADQQKRELGICLAQAYITSGDLGMGRSELERLLATNERDTQLLQQLSKLAEDEGDIETAAKYQKRLIELAPSEEGSQRLAQLYTRFGDLNEAQVLWKSMASNEGSDHQVLQAIDSLLGNDKAASVIEITEPMLRQNPNNWEALYREAVALQGLKRFDESKQRFESLMSLKIEDDSKSAIAKARSRNPQLQSSGARVSSVQRRQPTPIEERVGAASAIRMATKIESRPYYYASRLGSTSWAPADFGQARMAAVAWLYSMAMKEGKAQEDAFLAGVRAAKSSMPLDPVALWNWYLLTMVRQDYREGFESSRLLSKASNQVEAVYAFLNSLSTRQFGVGSRYYVAPGNEQVDGTPPLPDEDIDLMMTCYQTLRQRQPELLTQTVVNAVNTELKRAKKGEAADQFYREALEGAEQTPQIVALMGLAAQRGDVDGLLKLCEKLNRLQEGAAGISSTGTFNAVNASNSLAQCMAVRADAKQHDDILRMLDHYLENVRRRNEQPLYAQRARQRLSAYVMSGQYGLQIWMGKTQRYIQIAFPLPNEFYDSAAITLLRNAFELYRRDDLLSDLIAHFRAQVDAAKTPAEVFYPRLALTYLLWWNDDKDSAIAEFTQVADSTHAESDLRLVLADLHEQRGDIDEALALVEAVKPLDNATTQRREEQALRLAVLTGNLPRARQAAERLFGLRLDTETQLRLASQMSQLGMHDLAESVLGRARRRAGGKASALVGLMTQYQIQDKQDIAQQIALQILRSTTAVRYNTNQMYYNQAGAETDGARSAAIQVLARSGKIKEMIARVEEQLVRTPNAVQLHQALADYFRAAGERDKARAELMKLAELRPEDANLRFTVGNELLAEGKSAEAVELFKSALLKDPSLLGRNYYQVTNAFVAAEKTEELAELFENLDIRTLGQPYYVMNIIQTLLNDEKLRDRAITVFKKAWEAMPAERPQLMSYLQGDLLSQIPEMYEYARQSLLPDPSTFSPPAQWMSFQAVNSYDNEGRVGSLISRVLDISEGQNRLEELSGQVDQAIKDYPAWHAGRLIQAMISCRLGDPTKARAITSELLNKKSDTLAIPSIAIWILGDELEKYGELRDLAIAAYELGVADRQDTSNLGREYSMSPARRLVQIYRAEGRDEDVRRVLKQFTKPFENTAGYDEEYLKQMRIGTLITVASELVRLGDTSEAVPLYGDAAALAETMNNEVQYRSDRGSYLQQIRQGMTNAFASLDEDQLARGLASLIESAQPQETGQTELNSDRKPAQTSVNLVVLIHPRELDKAMIRSLFDESVSACSKEAARLKPVAASLRKLRTARSDDVSVLIASALVALAIDDDTELRAALDELHGFLKQHPLENLPAKARPNSRQRNEALRQVPVWLVARACWKRDALRSDGDLLAEVALEAARRQGDSRWLFAMLRERGALALEKNDQKAAEAAWSAILDQILKRESGATSNAKEVVVPGTPVTPAAPAGGSTKAVRIRPISFKTPGQDSTATLRASSAARQQPVAAKGEGPGPAGTPVLPLDRYTQAMELAKLAASNGMHDLSFRAVRLAHAGGPPVQVVTEGASPRMIVSSRGLNNSEAHDPVTPAVVGELIELDRLWKRHKAEPSVVYETLRDVVMPPARSSELFAFTAPLGRNTSREPQSVARLTVDWAVRARKVDDLRAALATRRALPASEVAALVIESQLASASKDFGAARQALESLARHMETDKLKSTAELACHAALPAFQEPETRPQALAVLDSVVNSLDADDTIEGNSQWITLMIAREYLRSKDVENARKRLRSYLDSTERLAGRYGGDYILYLRKYALHAAALEFARGGALEDALELLGRFADSPTYSGGDPPASAAFSLLLDRMSSLPAKSRYEQLRAWTLPTEARRSIRFLVGVDPQLERSSLDEDEVVAPEDEEPETPPQRDPVVSNTVALVNAARELGTLEELATEVAPLVEQKVENAEELAAYLDVELGRWSKAKTRLKERTLAIETEVEALPDPYASNSAPQRRIPTRSAPAKKVTYYWPDHVLLQSLLKRDDPEIRTLALRQADALIKAALRLNLSGLTTALKNDIALSRVARTGSEHVLKQRDGNLAHWMLAQLSNGGGNQSRSVVTRLTPWWVAHQSHVAQVAGGSRNALLFEVPMTGTYEFSVDVFVEQSYGGAIAHNGNILRPFNPGGNAVFAGFGDFDSINLPWPMRKTDDFSRLTISSTPDQVRYFVGSQLLYQDDDPSPTAPWVGLAPWSHYVSVMRNPNIKGDPTIPREVSLCVDDRLEGWSCNAFNETRPKRRGNDEAASDQDLAPVSPKNRISKVKKPRVPIEPEDFDWCAKDGVILGRRLAGLQSSPYFYDESLGSIAYSKQSLLSYYRPLMDGDVLTYEFFYEPAEVMVYPALDSTAFLIAPESVSLYPIPRHQPDEASVKPKPLPGASKPDLKPGDWNTIKLSFKVPIVTVELNGNVVLEYKLDAENSRQFGLYHDRDKTSAKVRNIKLSGSWPTHIDESLVENLLASRSSESDTDADRRARHLLIGERFFGLSANRILEEADELKGPARYDCLAGWVLPNANHPVVRFQGAFQNHPSATEKEPPILREAPRIPAIELVRAAAELGRLEALGAQVLALDGESDAESRRAKTALLALIALARRDKAEALAHKATLKQLLSETDVTNLQNEFWPELAVVVAALECGVDAQPLLDAVVEVSLTKNSGSPWLRQVLALQARERLWKAAKPPGPTDLLGTTAGNRLWHIVRASTPISRHSGNPEAIWTESSREIAHHAGPGQDRLYFATPLEGDFELECDVSRGEGREIAILYGDIGVSVKPDGKGFVRYQLDGSSTETVLTPPLGPNADWSKLQLIVKNKNIRFLIDGRQIQQRSLPKQADPWLMLLAPAESKGAVRALKLKGEPTVPQRLAIGTLPDLAGWSAREYGQSIGTQNADWERRGQEIIGRRTGDSRQTGRESVLRYHRPLIEDGTISYEFFYDPDHEIVVHPALGTRVSLLGPEGVRQYRLSDGPFGAGSASNESHAATATSKSPLKAKEWNRVEIDVTGDRMRLRLNDVVVEEANLPPSDREERGFGFFHFVGTEARIRDVIFQGNWSPKVPDDLIPGGG